MRVFIGLDLGTSAVKAAAADERGQLVATAGAPYATASPQAGWAEQDALHWTRAARLALRDLVARLPASACPVALALSGQLPTLALLDDAGRALRPAIVWYDGRADEEAAAMLHLLRQNQRASIDGGDTSPDRSRRPLPCDHDDRSPWLSGAAGPAYSRRPITDPDEWYRRSGVVLDAHYLAPMYAWVAAHEPAALRGAHRLCSAKDALLYALTGVWATDPSTASGYGVYASVEGRWDAALCTASGVDPHVLPPLAESWTIAGALRDEWHDTGLPAGLPVVVGAGDALTGVLGCGGATPGAMAAITGTSTSMLVSAQRPIFDPARRFLLTPHALPGLWGLEMDLMSTGSALGWLAELLGLGHVGEIHTLAAAAPPGARGLVGLPYLAGGEQGALWDATARGAFAGLSLRHGPAELARALLEGIAFEMRRCLLAWAEAGVDVEEVVLAGAGGADPFAHLLAAVLDRPVRIAATAPASALGAALLAGIGAGAWDGAGALALARATLGEPVTAAPGDAARYAALYARYVTVSDAFRELAAHAHDTTGRRNAGL